MEANKVKAQSQYVVYLVVYTLWCILWCIHCGVSSKHLQLHALVALDGCGTLPVYWVLSSTSSFQLRLKALVYHAKSQKGDCERNQPRNNNNYGATGRALKVDLLHHPEQLSDNATIYNAGSNMFLGDTCHTRPSPYES
ncbi:unnamed protein product [Sphagnum troendelagicum]|uniref:Uncharacterized protein n=1 Tax=Sphagnum troendelagicum TaxID=128251 RepID=A0ABP0TLE9_9BRYO